MFEETFFLPVGVDSDFTYSRKIIITKTKQDNMKAGFRIQIRPNPGVLVGSGSSFEMRSDSDPVLKWGRIRIRFLKKDRGWNRFSNHGRIQIRFLKLCRIQIRKSDNTMLKYQLYWLFVERKEEKFNSIR